MQSFPIADLRASRGDRELQREHADEVADVRGAHAGSVACPTCNASGSELSWFYFSSPPWTWQHLCGRAGVIAFCDRDEVQVASFISLMN
ncbi:MAG TPA: hypothetical protein VM290_01250 [Gaiellaceae bacterium]|nr:hypothetical protein [Gaiellaceae bacterium]